MMASSDGVAGLPVAAPPDFVADVRRERLRRDRGDMADSVVGTTQAQRHQRARSAAEQPDGVAHRRRRAIEQTSWQ
jgi:hypothetical protein